MSPNKFRSLILLLILSVTLSNCRKDIDVPSPELENLFGTWEWVQSSGGWGGSTFTSDDSDNTQSVQFSKDGVYKLFENGNMVTKRKFIITGEESPYYAGKPTIEFLQTGLFDSNDHLSNQWIIYIGEDSLHLREACSDCYGHIYVRN